ncbi:aminotransferase class I and II domain-containing protein [Phthorimaea operculella]|nr:aminotransferase class I and II domain-containing protein [Phthorimaea operculella]
MLASYVPGLLLDQQKHKFYDFRYMRQTCTVCATQQFSGIYLRIPRSASVGAYSAFTGLRLVRSDAARYLTARDGVPASPHDIILGSGATDLIKSVLQLFAQDVDGKPTGVMIPIPQYPLFSSALTELGLHQVDYFLNEGNCWSVCLQELRRAWSQARSTCNVRAIVVINPGNPTAQVLSRANIEEIIQFAYEHNLFVFADEVYQENIISKPFHSFKKVKTEMGDPYSRLEMASFMTASKGWAAECGLRGAFMELQGIQPAARTALLKSRGVMQCPNILGQIALDCILRPPEPGEPSYEQFTREKSHIQQVLCERTALVFNAFNSIPGFSCNRLDGTMCAFPRVEMPSHAQAAAASRGVKPDEFYCMRLLEETGICVVPGSGFGQRAGTYHFRTTILHPHEELVHMLAAIDSFHQRFLQEYH